jgi:hypothetical protein
MWGAMAAGVVATAPGAPATAAGSDSNALAFSSPRDNLAALVRVMGDASGKLAPWWYTGTIYGVRPNEAPRPLVRFEGSEINLFVPFGDGAFRQTGSTTTFFQDFYTGAALTEFTNPYSGARNSVRANKLGGSGFVEWSPDGVEPYWGSRSTGKQPLHVSWTTLGDRVWMRHDRVFPAEIPQPIYEASTSRVGKRDLLNKRLASCPAEFSSSYIARWPTWLEMGDSAGHAVWHADGVKLPHIEALPKSYLQRLRAEFPEQLKVAAPPS